MGKKLPNRLRTALEVAKEELDLDIYLDPDLEDESPKYLCDGTNVKAVIAPNGYIEGINHNSAASLSANKDLSYQFLEDAGKPYPPYYTISHTEDIYDLCRSLNNANQFAHSVGYPVIIKPNKGSHSIGVKLVQNETEWVEKQGVPLKVEKDMRVFPVSNDGKDIVGIFEKIFEKENINVLFKKAVKGIKKSEDKFILDLETEKLEVDKVILTTGGQAYRHTGSTGDGYSLAESLGHSCTDLAASLSSYIVEENWVKELTGVSFPNVQIKFSNKHKFIGPILFTHRGISGPATFALSSLAAFEEFDRETLYIDFVPDKNYEEVKNLIEQYSKANPKKSFYFNLAQFFSKSMAKSICTNLEISQEKICQELSNKDLNKSIEAIKNTSITLTGKTPGDEFVTAGGVKLEEVNSKTMESRICPGLYFAGELLDIDGFTGGYNLQVAWCTGNLAGESAAG